MSEHIAITQSFDPDSHSAPDNLPMPGFDPDPDPVVPLPLGTHDEFATYLTSGYWTDTDRDQRSFGTTPGNSSQYVITVDLTGLTQEGQRLARWALDTWELVADLHFTEVNRQGDITFDDIEDGAFSTSDVDGAQITSSTVNVAESWITEHGATVDSYAFSAYVHEIGHSLGLGHPGNYNGNNGNVTFANDSYQVSVMSYIDQASNPNTDASSALPVSPMMADILAIQSLYGLPAVPDTAVDENTTWGQGGTFSRHFATLFASVDDDDIETFAFAIYDRSGTDLIDMTPSATNNRLDMNEESFSDIAGLVGNLGIARGTVIENAHMGAGHDTVIGNAADNTIRGHGGRDQLSGGAGNDHLVGGGGRDRLSGGSGDDRLIGGAGRDRLSGGSQNDILFGRNGNDKLDGGEGNDQLFGGRGQDQFFFGFGHDRDKIKDFTLDEDTLAFSAIDFGHSNAQDLVDTYGRVTGRGIVLDFSESEVLGAGYNDTLILIGVYELDALADDIIFI